MAKKLLLCILAISAFSLMRSPPVLAQGPCDIPKALHHLLSPELANAVSARSANLFMDKQTLYAVVNVAGCTPRLLAVFNKRGGAWQFESNFFSDWDYINRQVNRPGFTKVGWANLKLPISWAGAQMLPAVQAVAASGAVRAAVVPLVVPKCLVNEQCVADVAQKIPILRRILPPLPSRPVNN